MPEPSVPERPVGERRFTGRHMLLGMLAFYAVIIGVNLTMAFSAGRSWTGLLTDNVYIESQRYGDTLRANRAAAESGIDLTVSQRDGRLAFTLAGADPGTRIESARAERPVGEEGDRDLVLAAVTATTFLSHEPLPRGAWNVTVPVIVPGVTGGDTGGETGGETHVMRRRVHIRSVAP